MKKSDKKIENKLRISLTSACEELLEAVQGFEWLTHLVDYAAYPKSLKVICVFDTEENRTRSLALGENKMIFDIVQKHLSSEGINLASERKQLLLDSEENCLTQNQGRWPERLAFLNKSLH